MTRRTTKPADPSAEITTDLTQYEKSDLNIRKAETVLASSATKAELAVRILELENGAEGRVKSAAEEYLIRFFQDIAE